MFFHKFQRFFNPQKVEKSTLKSCSEKLKTTFVSLLPAQPKWPNQKNSCSQMWPIERLYTELGFVYAFCVSVENLLNKKEKVHTSRRI